MLTRRCLKTTVSQRNDIKELLKNIIKNKKCITTNFHTFKPQNLKFQLARTQYSYFGTFPTIYSVHSTNTPLKADASKNTLNELECKQVTTINHFKMKTHEYSLPHPIWTDQETESINITHRNPQGVSDKTAYYSVQLLRKSFDFLSGYTIGYHLKSLDERAVMNRCIFLETVAGVPGFSAAMIRHLNSLRRMKSDHGWIHTLLEEAENERMHLMTFTTMRNPGFFFRGTVIATQWIFTAGFSLAYLLSPNFCHRFVGYLEEEAVKTYTHIIEEIDAGRLPMWQKLPAPEIAVDYWKLDQDAMMRDVILAIRADEAHHRDVNHTLGSLDECDKNPFPPGH